VTEAVQTNRDRSARLVIFAGLLIAFAALGALAAVGHLDAPDRYFLRLFYATFGSAETTDQAWFRDLMEDISALGGAPVLILILIGACTALSIHGKKLHAALLIAAALAGQFSVEIIKTLLNRARPGTDLTLEGGFPRGFPSGHTAEATIVFMTIAVLVAALDVDRRIKTLAFGMAGFVSIGVGMSRLHLGAHWPSDIVAAWLLGLAWALLARIALERFEKTV
jgi:undecaprenyl-diphosphatase